MSDAGPVRRPLVMGILNVTPDSFSDGGEHATTEAAVEHGRRLVAQGADLVDVGGESTRPGAARVDEAEELRRVVPVVEALAADGIKVSIDTTRARVARACVGVGAGIVNDVSGGLADPVMPGTVASLDVPFVVMHWRAHSATMQNLAEYDDVVTDVLAELDGRVRALVGAGVDPARLVLDPGIGFSKTAEHNWQLLAALDRFVATGSRVLVGASRKRFLGSVGRPVDPATGEVAPHDLRPVDARDVATAVVSAASMRAGAWAVRVHDVPATVDAFDVTQALLTASGAR